MLFLDRLDISKPVDMAALCGTGVFHLNPEKNQFGFHLTGEGLDTFKAKINIEVQWADEQSIAAVERNGGRITTAYYDIHSVIALSAPLKFFKQGAPIPRRLTPPGNLLHYYIDPANRGYLADPAEVEQERIILAEKYGYVLPEKDNQFYKFNKEQFKLKNIIHQKYCRKLFKKLCLLHSCKFVNLTVSVLEQSLNLFPFRIRARSSTAWSRVG